MRYTDIHLSGFGIYRDQHLRDLSPGLVVFVGDNEAGKSTLLGFIRGVLFGYPTGTEKENSYPALRGGRDGGSIKVSTAAGHRYLIARYRDKKVAGEAEVTPLDGAPEASLDALLKGVTRESLRTVFAFSLSDLQNMKALHGDELRGVIYGASMGVGIAALPQVQKQLTKNAKALLTTNPKPLVVKAEQLQQLHVEIEAAVESLAQYDAFFEQRSALINQISQAQADLEQAEKRLHAIDQTRRMIDPWERREQIIHQIAALPAELDRVPENALQELTRFTEQASSLDGLITETQNEIERAQRPQTGAAHARAHDGGDPIEVALAACRPGWSLERLEAFAADEARADIKALETPLAEKDGLLTQARADLSSAERALVDAETRLDTARQQHARATAAGGQSVIDIETRIERLAQLEQQVHAITGLQTTAEQLATLAAEKQRALRDHRDRPQVKAATAMLVLGAALSLSGAVALGVQATTHASGGVLAVGGVLMLVGIALVAVQLWQKRAEAAAAREIEARLELELNEASSKASQAQQRERTARDAAANDAAALALRGALTLESISIARRDATHDLGEAGALREKTEALRQHEKTLNEARAATVDLEQRLDARKRERARLSDDLVDVLSRAGLPSDLSPGDALALVSRLEVLAQRSRQLHRLHAQLAQRKAQRKTVNEHHAALLAAAGCATDDDLRALAEAVDRRDSLRESLREVEQTLRVLSDASDPEAWAAQVGEVNLEGLAADEAQLSNAVKHLQIALHGEGDDDAAIGLHNRKTKLDVQLDALSDADTLSHLRAREASLRAELSELATEWSRLVIAKHLLDEAWKRFERDAQPRVVQDAGGYLSTFTQGAYREVRARLTNDSKDFDILDSHGGRKSVDALSSGTQEQFYLALRFGFIRHQQREGVTMPLVIDDILVNFDPTRAKSAARAIIELAQETQVLLFTCHPSTVALLQSLAPDVPVVRVEDGVFRPQG
ncbi:MAG: hypothetical protein EB084_20940 [Proteobacteria bacterium]|nr:hypothetical protein [Pseudomonadota bacterium]